MGPKFGGRPDIPWSLVKSHESFKYSLVKERKKKRSKVNVLTHSAQKLVQTYLIIFLKPKMFLMLRKLTAEKSVKNFHNKIDNFCKMLMKLKINLSQPTIFLKR